MSDRSSFHCIHTILYYYLDDFTIGDNTSEMLATTKLKNQMFIELS